MYKKDYTDDELIRRVWDVEEIKKLGINVKMQEEN